MGRREQENRKRKAAAKSCQSLDTWVSKVPRQEPSDADNDSAVCEDSPAETTGAIHSTKIPTGPTGKRGPPQKVDPFFRNFSGWTEPIH